MVNRLILVGLALYTGIALPIQFHAAQQAQVTREIYAAYARMHAAPAGDATRQPNLAPATLEATPMPTMALNALFTGPIAMSERPIVASTTIDWVSVHGNRATVRVTDHGKLLVPDGTGRLSPAVSSEKREDEWIRTKAGWSESGTTRISFQMALDAASRVGSS